MYLHENWAAFVKYLSCLTDYSSLYLSHICTSGQLRVTNIPIMQVFGSVAGTSASKEKARGTGRLKAQNLLYFQPPYNHSQCSTEYVKCFSFSLNKQLNLKIHK